MCFCLWFAALTAAQALRDVFVFVPGFVPWNGESPRSFFDALSVAAAAGVVAVAIGVVWKTSVRAAAGRFVNRLGLWPASMRQALRWAAVSLGLAAVLWATSQLVLELPGLTSVPATEDPRTVAVAQTSTTTRFGFGLIAPAPLEELFYRAPILALWLALLAEQRRGSRLGRWWVRWLLVGAAAAGSAIVFAARHSGGGSANVAHAAVLAVTATAASLWQRSLVPALAAHGLYDAWAFAWG
ncbi:CAAX prenyl protease-like protein [Streptomyces sp. TLI_146]|nr:CAAX prenyl protease-like protein [Streptomyces sp. TLI_146]